ncbi:unnamed protein product, partial [Tuber aestivum]
HLWKSRHCKTHYAMRRCSNYPLSLMELEVPVQEAHGAEAGRHVQYQPALRMVFSSRVGAFLFVASRKVYLGFAARGSVSWPKGTTMYHVPYRYRTVLPFAGWKSGVWGITLTGQSINGEKRHNLPVELYEPVTKSHEYCTVGWHFTPKMYNFTFGN